MMYPEVVHVAMGDLLRKRVQETPEQKWLDIMDMMRDGKMAPEVKFQIKEKITLA